jgi:SWI/SNF-related matrix-associated actin-dependent regulator 1 of chromatin subfamily A
MRFAPSMEVVAYYGSQKDRIDMRYQLRAESWNVMITTYNLAQGDERDRKFFRKFDWQVCLSFLDRLITLICLLFQCCIFDEGHVLKNFDSQRYAHLMKIDSKWRLLLTGTPLQNNLQELVVCLLSKSAMSTRE